MREIIKAGFERAYRLLDDNRAILERCAEELLNQETLDEEAIGALTRDLVRENDSGPAPTDTPRAS